MITTTQAQQIAAQFDELQAQAVKTISGATDEQWQQVTAAEGWTVAATAHHLAIVQRAFIGMVEKLAAGQTYSPKLDIETIHAENAEHAREYAEADRAETLDILKSSGADMAKLLHGFNDGDLERDAGTFGGNKLSVAQVLEYVVIGHAREHLTSIQNTIGG